MPTLMVCPHCGGPLPEIVAEAPFVACWYCGATSNVDAGVVTQRDAVGRDPAPRRRAPGCRRSGPDLDESLRTRGGVLARLAVAYMDAVGHLRDQPQYELNLPFVFATPEGPRHYRRMLDVPTIQALAERDPAASVATAGPKKRFWSKLFG